jgi:spore germination protein YaaH
LSDFYGIEINYLKSKNVIIIDFKNHVKQIAQPISSDAVIRTGRSIRYPVIKKIDLNADKTEDNTLRIFEEYDGWYKVGTQDGEIGYIEKKFVVVKMILVNELPKQEDKTAAWKPDKGKISLAWDMEYEKRSIPVKEKKIDGLDVLSPTWFQVANEQGTLINRSDAAYVEWAHKNGYKVWALLSNDTGDTSMTHKFLTNTDSRDNLIRQLLTYSALYKLDGINIDFENINIEDKGALTEFVREITPFLKEQGLVVSIDVTPVDGSENWSLCFDRKEIGKVVDFVCLMAYDQSWPKEGPNAQEAWVEKTLTKVLPLVPAQKLLLGIPFYTRIWKDETDKSGKVKSTASKGMSIDEARKNLKDNNAPVKWDEKSGQFYSEYKKDNIMYKVWLEDENSINLKSALILKYRLAGCAIWSKNDSDDTVWEAINKNLKLTDNFQDWDAANKDSKYTFK